MRKQSSNVILERLEKAEQLKLAGQYDQALAILEELLVDDPENVSALEEVADNELSLEHDKRAEAAASQAVRLDSQSYTGHYILGFLRSQKKQWKEALDHLQLANRFKPNNAEILRCLGWALFHGGERAQGIVTLERALNLDRENPLTLCDLGTAYLQTRHTVKAKALLQRTLELDPANARAQECFTMLKEMESETRTPKREVRRTRTS
jgi:Tfp pilus assembly protein PilF